MFNDNVLDLHFCKLKFPLCNRENQSRHTTVIHCKQYQDYSVTKIFLPGNDYLCWLIDPPKMSHFI